MTVDAQPPMAFDSQFFDAGEAIDAFVTKTCRRCGEPIQDCDGPAFREWCDSMRRLLVMKTLQPEQCHQQCFVAALTADTAPKAAAKTAVQSDKVAVRVRSTRHSEPSGGLCSDCRL